jgi:putative ABC transport system substrate-binding protein
MRRREFLGALGAAVTALPMAARAQQSMPTIGFLHSASLETRRDSIAAFLRGLGEGGYQEGRNVAVEFAWAGNQSARLPELAAELVRRRVVLILAGGPPAALAAKAATATVPVVFTSGDDPIRVGLVSSLNHPGGNVTGINLFLSQMEGKRLGLLRDLLPTAATVGVMLNPEHPTVAEQLDDVRSAALSLGFSLVRMNASAEADIHRAFVSFRESHISALLVASSPFFNSQRQQLTTLAAHYKIPAIYELRDYAESGGLMSYGTSLDNAYYQAGLYGARILKGEKPGDLPVMQASRFEFVINLKTATALGLTIPPTLLARADEVIE